MSEIQTEYTDEPICPHCGAKHEDAWEWGGGRRDEGTKNCRACRKPFEWERETSVTYTTCVPAQCTKENGNG